MEEDRYTRITLRLPKELHARLDQAADRTSKSLNAEIVGRLEESFRADSLAMNEGLLFELRRTQLLMEIGNIDNALGILNLRRQGLERVIYEPGANTEALTAARDEVHEIMDKREPLEHSKELAMARLAELEALREPFLAQESSPAVRRRT